MKGFLYCSFITLVVICSSIDSCKRHYGDKLARNWVEQQADLEWSSLYLDRKSLLAFIAADSGSVEEFESRARKLADAWRNTKELNLARAAMRRSLDGELQFDFPKFPAAGSTSSEKSRKDGLAGAQSLEERELSRIRAEAARAFLGPDFDFLATYKAQRASEKAASEQEAQAPGVKTSQD
jgi:hypothetical protein